ncbi:MAG TPA: 16S rRNA (guanine(527)-N(7))-methyltransferase RsmG [Spirochaetota bacterium]
MSHTENRRARMEDLFRRAGLNLSPAVAEKFWKFYLLFDRYNDEYDLSRIKRFDEIVIKHLIDSAIVSTLVKLPTKLLDIGTGAGFPGLPLKFMDDNLSIILAEPKDKRVAFMEMVIRDLSLSRMTVYPKRVGDHSDFEVDGVITRAFEAVDGTLTRVKHFLPENGQVIFMKGPSVEEDLGAVSPENERDYEKSNDIEYELPLSGHTRRLVIYRKRTSFREHVYTATDSRYAAALVSSADNKSFKECKKLLDPKGMKKAGMALVSGKKIVADVMRADSGSVEGVILFEEYRERDEELHTMFNRMNETKKLTLLRKGLFNELDIFGTEGPIALYRYREPLVWEKKSSGITLLIPFQDPSNVGSVIRAAAAFGVKRAVILRGAAHPYHPKSVRASAGAVFTMELLYGPSIDDIVQFCSTLDLPVVALDAKGDDIREFDFPESFALLPGVEGPGFPDGFDAPSVSIPIESNVESLNASAASSVALFYITRIAKR